MLLCQGMRSTYCRPASSVLITRFPGSRHPTRRVLGIYGAGTLKPARDKARAWLELITQGIDPAHEAKRQRREQERRQRFTFAAVANDYLKQVVYGPDAWVAAMAAADGQPPERESKPPLKRTAAKIRNALVDILIPLFGQRPITELTADDDFLPAFELIARVGSDQASSWGRARNCAAAVARRSPAPNKRGYPIVRHRPASFSASPNFLPAQATATAIPP